MLLDSGANGAVDLNRLTHRCFLDDTATPEMYRECFYEDYRDKDLLKGTLSRVDMRSSIHSLLDLSRSTAIMEISVS